MERRNLALLCAGVVCFWLFALAFGTAQGKGLRIQPVVQAQAEPAVQTLTVTPPQLTLPCRAAILIDQTSGAVLYEMNADQTMPIASITKLRICKKEQFDNACRISVSFVCICRL